MIKSRVKYIGFYGSNLIVGENRNSFLSATNKMDYITNTLSTMEVEVEIVSPSWTKNQRGIYSGKKIALAHNISFVCGPSFGARSKIMRYFQIIFSCIWLIVYLIKNTTESDIFIVYHSILLMMPIMFLRKFKKNLLIVEVEEIYQDVRKLPNYFRKQEYSFFEIADRYIFPTKLLDEKINVNSKPSTVIHGTYQFEKERKCKFNDGKIHIVYAGTFDPSKGGLLAVDTALYLPHNFHVHIIGFGSVDETNSIIQKVNDISKIAKSTVTYDGLVFGEDYINFLQKCDIGLSTQLPCTAYGDTSFPSKILSYLVNGLRVVSIRINSIVKSDVGQIIYYYEKPDPKVIANTITSIDFSAPYSSRQLIEYLDVKFARNLESLLEN